MKIAQVAPLYESVPPHSYGGTERVVSWLTEQLVRLGHHVTLFASGDSQTSADLVPMVPRSLRLNDGCIDQFAHHVLMLERVATRAREFDLIHFHIDYMHFPLSRHCATPHVTTLHGRLDIPDLQPIYDEFSDMPVISISASQRKPLPQANWQGTVHHGLPRDLYRFDPAARPAGYLAFLGRISPEKRVDRAIEIARRLEMPLLIAAKIDRVDREYFESTIRPLLQLPGVEYVGEIGDNEKGPFLQGAAALLFPIDWPEPFGIVMIEAMACGTPVIAWRRGSTPEVITQGVSGFMVESMEEAVAATRRAITLDRRACRKAFEDRFTDERMARDYLAIYERLLDPAARLARTIPSRLLLDGPGIRLRPALPATPPPADGLAATAAATPAPTGAA
jgi:glycosyltransferase involved in cell wall biosynthesis